MIVDSHRTGDVRSGILLFSFGVLLFSLNDALGKWLVADYSVGQIMLVRTLGAAFVLVPMVARNPGTIKLRGQWGLHGLRVACMAVDSFSFYWATRFLPLADVMTFYLAAPLIITALSGPMLGERIGAFRWGAVIFGFLGVLIALRPSGAFVSVAAIIAFAGSCAFAFAIITTRKLRDAHWLSLVTWQFVGAGLIGLVTGPMAWVTPSLRDLTLMGIVGVLSMLAFICLTKALKLAGASILAPFHYASIVWAVILGWLIWDDIPENHTSLGVAIIVGSGLAVWWYENGRERLPAAMPVP